jgi:ethanolamine utilization protein EutQ (cupin superfamily)
MDQQAAVERQVTAQIWNNQVRHQVVTQLSSQVRVDSQVWDQVTEQVLSTVGRQSRRLVYDQMLEETNGSTDSG